MLYINRIFISKCAIVLLSFFSINFAYAKTAEDVKRELFGNRVGSSRNYNDPDGVMARIQKGESAADVIESVMNENEPEKPENLDSLGLPESSTLTAVGNTSTEPAKQSAATTASTSGSVSKEMMYDAFDRLIQLKVDDKVYKYSYDYRGRRVVVDETGAGGKYITINYSSGTAVSESEADYPGGPSTVKRLYYRGPDMGGGVGGINYATDGNGNNPIYYHYNLRGDVIMKTDQNNNVIWAATYEAFGKATTTVANANDGARQRSNTKEADPTGFINEGHRYRDPETGVFLTPDPLEYVDGLNQYIYVGQNPWSRFDPTGLALVVVGDGGYSGKMFELAANTWVKNNGGAEKHTVVDAYSGKAMVEAINQYAKANGGTVDSLQVFSHSGASGLYLDMQPNSSNSIYTKNETANLAQQYGNKNAAALSDINPDLFNKDSQVRLWGCNTMNYEQAKEGEYPFAYEMAKLLKVDVVGSKGPTIFSGKEKGKPGEGLPKTVPANYKGEVHLVPQYPNKPFQKAAGSALRNEEKKEEEK